MLDKFREDHRLREQEHVYVLKELGWTAEEYEKGILGRFAFNDFECSVSNVR